MLLFFLPAIYIYIYYDQSTIFLPNFIMRIYIQHVIIWNPAPVIHPLANNFVELYRIVCVYTVYI